MTNNTCINCQHWNMRANRAMALQGFAQCALDLPHTFCSEQATCPKFKRAPDSVVLKRVEWYEKREALHCFGKQKQS